MKHYYLLILLLVTVVSQAQIVNIPDANFKNALLNTNCADLDDNFSFESNVDTNGDGEIQVSEAEAVYKLWLDNLDIASLEGIESFTNITDLRCESNLLTQLDLSSNTLLELVLCNDNRLVSLDVSQSLNLNRIHCNENRLVDLDFSTNTGLYAVNCDDNELLSLNVKNGNNTNIFQMWADYNTNLPCITVDNVSYSNSRSNWIKEDSTMYSEDCSNLSVDVYDISDFYMFPNPVQDILTISAPQGRVEHMKLFSIQGKLLKEVYDSNINIADFSAGLYIVQVTIDGQMITKKFIKS